MFKKMLVLLCGVMLLTGCGQSSPSQNSDVKPAEDPAQTGDPDAASDSGKTEETEDRTADNTTNPEESEGLSEEISENSSREPETVSLVMNKINGNEKVSVTMTGLCQYETLESDAYTDTPEDGNVYLVMFLNISNHDNGADYFNPEALSATVDEKEISHCVLFNQPESYPTIFDHIDIGEERSGFIAWQVPSDWKEFHMEYDRWKDICSLIVTADLTPDMLCAPPSLD